MIPIEVYSFPGFRGVDLKDSPLVTPPQFARYINFIDLEILGAITKSYAPVRINNEIISSNPAVLGLHEYRQNDGDKFLIIYTSNGKLYKVDYTTGATTDITPINVTIAAGARPHFITYNNLCIMGDGTNRPIYIHGAVSDTTIFYLGITAPSGAPSFGADTGGGSISGDYYYKITFYNSLTGQESNAGPASVLHTTASALAINLTGVPVAATTGEDNSATTTYRKIYRTAAGGSVYYYVGTITNNTTTTYADYMLDASLAVRLVEEREIPLNGMQGFVEFNGSIYGFVKGSHDLWYTRINESGSWGAFNYEPILPGDGGPLKGLGVLNSLVIFKEFSIHTWVGVPGYFRRLKKAENIGCVSHETIQNVDLPTGGNVLMFLSQFGPCMFDEENVIPIGREIETIFSGKDPAYTVNVAQLYKACAEYDRFTKRYILSVAVNGATENNLILIYDLYAQSWTIRSGVYAGSLSKRTVSDKLQIIFGESRSDITYGGYLSTLDGGTTYYAGAYTGEYKTSWNSLNLPNHVKLLRYLEVDYNSVSNNSVICDVYIDGVDSPVVSESFSMDPGGAVWDDSMAIWGPSTVNSCFARNTYGTAIFGLRQVKGRFISLGFKSAGVNQPFQILGARIFYQRLPQAGERR